MKTSSCKNKGRLFQQLIRDKITEILKPYGAVAEDVKSTSMGAQGVDVKLSPFAKSLLPIAPECKSHKSMAVYSLYEQAKANADVTKEEPVLFIKVNNRKPLVVIDLEYYLTLEKHRIDAND